MKNAKLTTLFLFLTCMLILIPFKTAPCFMLLDGKLEVSGFLENWSAWRFEDGLRYLHGFQGPSTPVHLIGQPHKGLEAGDYYLCRNTIQVEANYELLENLQVNGIWRAWYDASLDFSNRIERLIAQDERDDYTRENDLREIYVDFAPGNWRFRVGKQQIVWGESAGFRMADVINPLDYSWHFIHPDWEDIRLPLWMTDIRYAVPCNVGPFSNVFTEFVFIPNSFDGGFKPTKLAPHGANWSFPGYGQPFLDFINKGTPEESWRSAQYGMRLRGVVNGWDVTLFTLYTWTDLPVINFNKLLQWLVGGLDVNPMEYKRMMMVGGTFNMFEDRTKSVFRGECVFRYNEPHNSLDLTKMWRNESFAYMLGCDRMTWIRPLNKVHPFYLSAQVFQKYIFGWNDRMATSDTNNDQMQTLITFFAQNQYTWYFLPGGTDNVTPSFFGMYDPSGEGWARLQLALNLGDYWAVNIGTNMYWASDTAQSYFGWNQDNSQGYINIRFKW